MSNQATPNPGSQAALAKGCTCPVIDNYYGAGIPYAKGPSWWIAADCKLHGVGSNWEPPK